MADDDLLLNFSTADGISIAKPLFKGGKWKDRLSARKVAQHQQKKFIKSASHTLISPYRPANENTSSTLPEDGARPSKRPRRDTNTPNFSHTSDKAISGAAHNPRQTKSKSSQVISSLFSFNPSPKEPENSDPGDTGPVEPSNAPVVDGSSPFISLGLSPALSTHLLNKLTLKDPTAIQKLAIPALIKGSSDAFIQAETGSGKTLAYLLPIVQRIMALSSGVEDSNSANQSGIHRDSGLFAIVLAPTRELCRQIYTVLESLLGCAHWIVAGTVIGGEKKKSEKARLRKGLNILVATPGRLADHLLNTEVLNVKSLRWLVLDEGDSLMEMGFEEEIKGIVAKLEERSHISATDRIFQNLPPKRITILCSATMKMDVQRLGEISLKQAIHLKSDSPLTQTVESTGPDISVFLAPAQLKQTYSVVPAKLRLVTLAAVLKHAFARRGSVMKVIVFLSSTQSVDFHYKVFTRVPDNPDDANEDTEKLKTQPKLDLPTEAPAPFLSSADNPVTVYKLHGKLDKISPHLRRSTLAAFTKAKDPCVLICTDVGSRGLDLNIDLVVEVDPPTAKEIHLHRIGRTARAGKAGRALMFLLPGGEEGYIKVLQEGHRSGSRGIINTTPESLLQKGFKPDKHNNNLGNAWEAQATSWQLEVERWVLEDPTNLELARAAFQKHVGAYTVHREREIFNVKTLHLGHLAKAFALRDPPRDIKALHMRGEDSKARTTRRKTTVDPEKSKIPSSEKDAPKRKRGINDVLDTSFMAIASIDEHAARKKLLALGKQVQGRASAISEFNIG
ncbi:MAG: ATP-dependent RNA helicase dbp7 [Trizodia sp. TS-e1964]|nr:MAG: ATP-dependent RNA helicase dbp7 [Trizodia sp. TS-e1964]